MDWDSSEERFEKRTLRGKYLRALRDDTDDLIREAAALEFDFLNLDGSTESSSPRGEGKEGKEGEERRSMEASTKGATILAPTTSATPSTSKNSHPSSLAPQSKLKRGASSHVDHKESDLAPKNKAGASGKAKKEKLEGGHTKSSPSKRASLVAAADPPHPSPVPSHSSTELSSLPPSYDSVIKRNPSSISSSSSAKALPNSEQKINRDRPSSTEDAEAKPRKGPRKSVSRKSSGNSPFGTLRSQRRRNVRILAEIDVDAATKSSSGARSKLKADGSRKQSLSGSRRLLDEQSSSKSFTSPTPSSPPLESNLMASKSSSNIKASDARKVSKSHSRRPSSSSRAESLSHSPQKASSTPLSVLQGNSIAVNGVRAQLADLELSDARAKQTPSPSPLSSSQGTSGTQVNAVRAHIELSDARAKQRDLETRLASLTTEKKAKEMELSIALARIAILEAEKLDQEEEELVTHRATARNLQQSINDYKREAIGLEKLKIAMRDELKSKMVRKLDDNASSSSPRSATSDFTTENESSSEEDDEDAYALKLEEAAVDFTKLDDSSLDVQAALAERKRRTARRRAPASDRNGVPGDGKRLGSVSTAGSSAAAASGPSDSTGLKSSKSRRMNGSSSTTEDPESTSALAISHGSQLPDSIGAIVASPSKGSLKKLKGSASSGSKAAGGGRKANSSKSSLTGSVRKIDAIVWFKTHYIASCQQKGTKAVDDLLMALDRAISKGRRLTALDLNHYDLEPSDIMTLAIAFEKTRMDMEKVSHPSKKSDGNDVIHAPDRISKAKSAKGSSTDLTSKKASASPTVPLPKGSSSLSLASSSSTASLSPDMSNVLITNSFEPITVDLSHNRLGSSEGSGRCVADIVKEIGKVVALDVGSNGWGEKGALDFAASFAVPLDPPSRSSSSLSASGLNHNPIALLLVTFKCADNMIGNKGGMAVLEALEPCKSLAVLDVSNNALGDKVAPSLASLIQGCPLTTLSIKYNKFKTNGMKRLVLALAQNSTLTDMDFTQCGPGASEKSKELVELLESRENIKRLSIGFNKLPASSFVPRFTSFTAKQRQLVHLDLRGIDLPSKAMCQVLDAIAVNASNTLQELVLNGNALDSKCLEVLIDYLTRSHTLQNLGLRGCGLPRGPLLELLATVKHSSSLHTLDLSGNSLNHRRILDSLCSCIQNNTSLKLLGLAACKLDHAIIGLIGQALQFNKSIEKLHVDGNKLGERGLADLATGLAGNDVLKVISIRSTHISARALLSFVASITAKTQTEVIDAGDNDLPVSNKSFRERLEQFDAVAVKI